MLNNLPSQRTSFVGREQEIAEITRLLGSARLLTLTSVGGGGKTRLARQVATGLLGAYPGGVWFVELAPLSDPSLVVQWAHSCRRRTGPTASAPPSWRSSASAGRRST